MWKVSPLPKVSPSPSKVSSTLQCISNGQVCHLDILFESKPRAYNSIRIPDHTVLFVQETIFCLFKDLFVQEGLFVQETICSLLTDPWIS